MRCKKHKSKGEERKKRVTGDRERQGERDKERERDALFESGLLWKHSVSMATIKIGLHAYTYRRS